MSNLISKLSEIQRNLKAPKGQYNKFGNYKYRSCEDILEAVKQHLNPDTALTINDELSLIGDRYYIKATATFYYKDQSISSTAYARESATKKGMDDSQITGSCSSYARKYALNALLLTDDTKDADTMDNSKNQAPKTQNLNNLSKIDIGIQKAFSVLTKNGQDKSMTDTLHRDLGVNSILQIYKKPDEQKNEMLDFLRNKYKQTGQSKGH